MKPVVQEDDYGCAVACVAFKLKISYLDARDLFENGEKRAKEIPNFYCKEICFILGEDYNYKYIKPRLKNKIYKTGTIIFIKKNKKFKFGHYLIRSDNRWMDPWINFPNEKRISGFRIRLPGSAIYMIYK